MGIASEVFTPLTPHQFRAVVKTRGWTFAEVAQRWGVTPERVSQIANQPDKRAPHWEDALFGLPHKRAAERTRQQRLALAGSAGNRLAPRKANGEGRRGSWVVQAPYLAQGSVFIVTQGQSEDLDEGMRGALMARRATPRPQVLLLFESGYREWLDEAWLADPTCWLQYNGQTLPGFATYPYTDESRLLVAWRTGVLRFP
jgi:hypothetical protein